MTECNTLNAKLSNSQFSKLKSEIKNVTQVTLTLSSNVVCETNDQTNFRINCEVFANGSSANIKLLIKQLFEMVQLRVVGINTLT